MAVFLAFALLAVAPGGPQPMPAFAPTKGVAPAQATVRILSGAKVRLSEAAQTDGHAMKPAQVTVEDGSKRPAQLVEFQ